MTTSTPKELCLALMAADSEEDVIKLLRGAGYWEDREVWRYYGDHENNYNTIGNQQSRPDAALVEKLVNSVDARLMNECLLRRIDPENGAAPKTIRQAVALFFEGSRDPKSSFAGRIREWPITKRTEVSRGITLAATGATPTKGNPCFTISDCGEGQTPEQMPETLLSLTTRSNKLRIPFVQGKFNMGGTGVLKFCGRHNLQLVISRRSPGILKAKGLSSQSDTQWGFTVVRREDPEGTRRSSTYTYMAPVGAKENPGKGGVLRFTSQTMPIFPDGKNAYGKESEWGTLIKLYDYTATGYKSHILMKDGILSRIDLLLPDVALPMRFHECRSGYRGHAGSFETTLTGLRVRLDDDRGENLENDFPASAPINVMGEEMTVMIYAFKKGRGSAYRKNEGIIFVVNGQTHGYLTQDFFSRKKVGLSYLADSILVIVDCSKLSGRAREDLFMNSRDRLSGGELRTEIEKALEDLLKNNDGLRALKERRRREEIEAKLDDSRPLEDILQSLLKRSPTLAALFLQGKRATTPFKTKEVQTLEKRYEGERFPTYFRFKGKNDGFQLQRECHISTRCRVSFETDAINEYFSRDIDPGEFSLSMVHGNGNIGVQNYVLNLQNGIATLSLDLPPDTLVGQAIKFVSSVTDASRIVPFENSFVVRVKGAVEKKKLTGKKSNGARRKPPGDEDGAERDVPTGIQLPNIISVNEEDWSKHTPPFDKYSALRIKNAGEEQTEADNGNDTEVYDFYINVDNVYLNSELKTGAADPEVTRARFKYGMVLMGLALLQHDTQGKKNINIDQRDVEEENEYQENIEGKVEVFTKAIAPILIPMITSLGDLDLEDSLPIGTSGEVT